MAEVIEITKNQPKPKFTLLDLEGKLEAIYQLSKHLAKATTPNGTNYSVPQGLLIEQTTTLLSSVQELLAQVSIAKNNLDAIEMPVDTAKVITDTIETEKPQLIVCGAQLYEYGKMQGVSLYTTIVKARKIRDICNERFAQLKVDHMVKIQNYPVY